MFYLLFYLLFGKQKKTYKVQATHIFSHLRILTAKEHFQKVKPEEFGINFFEIRLAN